MKSGFIALIGRPNAGKSTLLNTLVNQKVAIISPKPQTTRNQIRAIYNDEDSQLVFIDTPGIHKPQHALGDSLNAQAFSASKGVDIIYLIVDGSAPFGKGDQFVLDSIKNSQLPIFLIVNKVDRLNQEQLFKVLSEWEKRANFQEIFPISALYKKNIDALIQCTKECCEEGIQYYPIDQISDSPEQFIMGEIIREKVLHLTEEEIPHSVAVVIEKSGRKKGKLFIQALIVVERDSQKGIIIGKQGRMIKQIGILARQECEQIFGETIYLELFVRVEENWRNKKNKLQQLGYGEEFDE